VNGGTAPRILNLDTRRMRVLIVTAVKRNKKFKKKKLNPTQQNICGISSTQDTKRLNGHDSASAASFVTILRRGMNTCHLLNCFIMMVLWLAQKQGWRPWSIIGEENRMGYLTIHSNISSSFTNYKHHRQLIVTENPKYLLSIPPLRFIWQEMVAHFWRIIILFACVQIGSGAHPALYPMGVKRPGAWIWALTSI